MQPEREIRLIQSAPDMPWEWALLHQGRTIATSMGEDDATTPAAALAGCLAAAAEVPE